MNRISLRIAILSLTLLFGIIGVNFWLNQSHSDNTQPQLQLVNAQPTTEVIPTTHSAKEADVVEAVLSKQLEWNQQEKVCFLTVEGKEPDQDFINRFNGHIGPRIEKNSEKGRDEYDRVIDSNTGEIAEMISIVSIKWISETEVEVHTNIYDGDVAEYTQNVVMEDDHWIAQDGHYLEEIPYKKPYYSTTK
jgi:hypothetical protein